MRKVCPFTMFVCPSHDFNCALFDEDRGCCSLRKEPVHNIRNFLKRREELQAHLRELDKMVLEKQKEKNLDRSLTNNFRDDMITSK